MQTISSLDYHCSPSKCTSRLIGTKIPISKTTFILESTQRTLIQNVESYTQNHILYTGNTGVGGRKKRHILFSVCIKQNRKKLYKQFILRS